MISSCDFIAAMDVGKKGSIVDLAERIEVVDQSFGIAIGEVVEVGNPRNGVDV
jgi:hypothetical protein